MATERTFYCDAPECERHVSTRSHRPGIGSGFLFVTEGSAATLHFCGWDCVLRYAAAKPPEEVIALND